MSVNTAARCRVACLTSPRELVDLRDDWNRLAGQAPMRGYEWATTWWQHYRTNRTSLYVLVVRDQSDAVVGIAPLYLTESPLAGRVIRFLGSGEVCSDYLSLLCDEDYVAEVSSALADYLVTERPAWDAIELSGVAEGDEPIAELAERLSGHGHAVDVRNHWNGWRLKLPASWPALLKKLSKSRRERTRKLERQNLLSGRATLRLIGSEAELNQAFDLLVELHQKRRASVGEAGCFRSARFTAFHRQVCHELLRCGQLRFLVLELDGQPIAAEYGLVGDRIVYYYQGGFDPDFADERPGWLSFAASLKWAIDEGFEHYDFLRGDEPYKASWRAEPIKLQEVRIIGDHRTARVRHAAWTAGQSARHWLKQYVLRRSAAEQTNGSTDHAN